MTRCQRRLPIAQGVHHQRGCFVAVRAVAVQAATAARAITSIRVKRKFEAQDPDRAVGGRAEQGLEAPVTGAVDREVRAGLLAKISPSTTFGSMRRLRNFRDIRITSR